jgi:hypothetical protein
MYTKFTLFTDWLKYVREQLKWEEGFILHQVTSAMKSHACNLHEESRILLDFRNEPHNITHLNAYAFAKKA